MALYDYRQHVNIHIDTGQQRMFAPMSPIFSMFGGFCNALMLRLTSCFNPYVQNYNMNQFYPPGGQSGIFYNQFSMPTFSNTTGAQNNYAAPTYQSLTYGIGDYFVPSARNNSAFYSNSFTFANSSVGTFIPTTSATSVSAVSPTPALSGTNTSLGTKDMNFWKSLGYNEEKGRQLLENAKHSQYRGARHQCVAVVREAINSTYYGGQTHYSRFGKACRIGDDFLCNDSHFKKIVPDWNASKNDFPPGAIIVYRGDDGNGGYVRGDNRGHGELAYGDGSGKGLSNYDLEIKPQYIKEVWIPV